MLRLEPLPGPQAEQAVRRRAAARRARPRDGAPPEGVPDGRAADEPRRRAARRHARRDQAPAAASWARRWSTSPTTRSRRWRSVTGSRSSTRAASSRSARRWRSTTGRRRCSRARFIGSPPMNLIEAEVTNGHLTAAGGLALDAAATASSAADRVVAGVRPERFDGHGTGRGHGAARGRVVSREALGDETIYVVETRGRRCCTCACRRRCASPRTQAGRPCATRAPRRRSTTRARKRWSADEHRDRRDGHRASRSATSQALDGTSTLDVPDGAFFVLLGPSGAGKTTTLRVDRRAREARRRARVHLTGIDATRATPAERDLAMVFQTYALYPKQTAAREHRLAAAGAQAVQGRDRRRRSSRSPSCCTSSSCSQRRPAQMSGGEMQRVALGARAGARPARVPHGRAADEPRPQAARRDAHRAHPHPPLARGGRSSTSPTTRSRPCRWPTRSRCSARARSSRSARRPRSTTVRPTAGSATFVGCAAHEPAPVHAPTGGSRATAGRCRTPASRVDGDRPALLGVRAEDLSLDVRDESAALAGKVYAVEPLGDRTLVDIEVGEQRIVVKAPPTASLRDRRAGPRVGRPRPRPPVRRRLGVGDRTAMIDAPLPPVLRRARILERVQRDGGASLAELASEHAVSPVTVHRDLELLSGEGLLERVRGGARSLPDAPAADRDGLERARARGGAREGRDRRCARASWSRTGRRSSSTPPRRAWRSRARSSCARRPS